MSPARQEELSVLLEKVMALEAVQELKPDRRMLRIHYDWLAAGEITQRTVAKLSGELRRYLDDKAWLENRRIMEILHEIESSALGIRGRLPDGPFMLVDDTGPDIRLPMDRPLFNPPVRPDIIDAVVAASGEDIPADALFNRVYVDKERLVWRIRKELQHRVQVSLLEICLKAVAAAPPTRRRSIRSSRVVVPVNQRGRLRAKRFDAVTAVHSRHPPRIVLQLRQEREQAAPPEATDGPSG
jgi:hypothetical protein